MSTADELVVAEQQERAQSDETFWTDSMVVKAYIQNKARRFHTFVANRVQHIEDHTSPDQWCYIASEDNPADNASRGLNARQLIHNDRILIDSNALFLLMQSLS